MVNELGLGFGFILGAIFSLISREVIVSHIKFQKKLKMSKEDKFILNEVPNNPEVLLKLIRDDLILKSKIGKTTRKKLLYYFK